MIPVLEIGNILVFITEKKSIINSLSQYYFPSPLCNAISMFLQVNAAGNRRTRITLST
jgi:hypothetical protein